MTTLALGPAPQPATTLRTAGALGRVDVSFTHDRPYQPLIDHYAIYASRTPGFAIGPDTLLAKTVYTRFRHDKLGGAAQTWYYRVVVTSAAGLRSAPTAEAAGTSVASVAVTGRPVVTIGTFDHKSLEFALAPNLSAQYPTRFPSDVDYTAGVSDPGTDWSYIHPGPADKWAGSKAHTATLRFRLDAVPDGEPWLSLWLIDTHATLAGKATLALNGTQVREITFEGGATRGSLEGDATVPGSPLRPSYVEFALPRDAFVAGDNTLTLHKFDGSWHVYDAIGIFTR